MQGSWKKIQGTVGTADILCSLMADAAARDVSGGAYISMREQRWCVAKQLYHDACAQCCGWSQPLHNPAESLFTGCRVKGKGRGAREPGHHCPG